MARATNDLNAVRMLLGPAIMYSANTVVFTAGALLFMLSISPKLTFYAFLPLPVVSIVMQYFGRQHSRALRAHPGHVLRHFGAGAGEFLRCARDSRLRAGRGGDRRALKAPTRNTSRAA